MVPVTQHPAFELSCWVSMAVHAMCVAMNETLDLMFADKVLDGLAVDIHDMWAMFLRRPAVALALQAGPPAQCLSYGDRPGQHALLPLRASGFVSEALIGQIIGTQYIAMDQCDPDIGTAQQ